MMNPKFIAMRLLAVMGSVALLGGCASWVPQETVAMPNGMTGKICPDWSSDPTKNYSNADFSNFGCAYHNNFYVQLQDPADLERGVGKSGMTAVRESAVLQGYMSGASSSAAAASSASSSR